MKRIRLMIVAAVLLAGSLPLEAKVAPTTLTELTQEADVIVLGRDLSVEEVRGWRVASLEIETVIKGMPKGPILYLAEPTWTCDSSTANPGERVLLFLEKGERQRVRARRNPLLSVNGQPIYTILSSGRGRMPIRALDGTDYATVWVIDVILPASLTTVDGPEPEYASFIRSTPLSAVLRLIESILE